VRRLRGLKSLVHDAVDFAVDMVEEGHESTARAVMRVVELLEPIAPVAAPARLVDELRRATTSRALDSVRAVNRALQLLTDAGMDTAVAASLVPWLRASDGSPVPMRSDVVGTATWLSDGAAGLLNGVVGDYLHRERNGLDLGFSLRHDDGYLDIEAPFTPPTRRVVVFVHGLGATEWSWCWEAAAYHGDPSACFGTLLRRDLGFTPLYARYNSGRHVFESGRALADALERIHLADGCDELVLIGHSMGGLVVRSACAEGARAGHAWVPRVTRVFCLAAPHRGAPLEKIGHVLTTVLGAVDHPATRIPAAILRRRSAGIRDLREGNIVDDAWLEADHEAEGSAREHAVPLLDGVAYYFLSATLTRDPEHPLGKLIGDVLVRVPSASGPASSEQAFGIETRCFGGIAHHQLQNHPDVYALVRSSCSST
jgi:triacylglycerol lipase